MEDEILLFEGDEKSPKYICNFIIVCSARDLVCAMNMDKDPLNKTLRNVLLNGLSSKEIYKECLKVDVGKLTSKAVMDTASNIQARNLMAEDLSMTAQQVLPENALTKGFPPLSSTPINRIRLQNHHPGASIQQKGCGWCGKQVRCSRNECPANRSTCNNCGKIGHWGKCAEPAVENTLHSAKLRSTK
ncbi:hypothetical protein CAPTEDRAFT_210824 [Capitella teleta]|uniref:CCHC-type domain-containing protein n=1 Tax=Capitella teleta TaxID=283909 RepID=R7U861_CAPTE|nr:hypothetical protein CAPTEDRAFT_210824 [Capitella teleta]|eukprot:ELT99841.1 hypothetical protein CAPTEDRAFT_210824 [Capitella teleta]